MDFSQDARCIPTGGTAILQIRDVRKRFQATCALDGVSLDIRAGEVHALLGENGAGKLTLLKILAGAQRPDGGEILLDGVPVRFDSPNAALEQGIATIYQEFSLFPNLTVAENIAVGRLPRKPTGFVDWPSLTERARSVLERIGITLDLKRSASGLSVAEQQLVEIARALALDARVIIMDEPTATLSVQEVARLQALIAELRANGTAILFVTHRLEEVKAFCDRYTILRDGIQVGSGHVVHVSIDDLVRRMIGRPLFDEADPEPREPGPVVLEIRRLSTSGHGVDGRTTALHDVSLEARRGEILGIAGLVGSGRTELARAIFGADAIERGEILLDGQPLRIRSPQDAIRQGIGLVPEDRKQQAIFSRLSITDNFAMASLRRLSNRFGFLDTARLREELERFTASFGIRMASSQQAIGTLSGGNQQKVILARWLALHPRVLIVDEPTRGIDIGAKAEVHHLLVTLARSGVAVIVISADLSELTGLADRIVTLRAGRIGPAFVRGAINEADIMRQINAGSPAVAAV
ncbi:MAG: sugar ABC transporter ATP-binding protein [Propionivibrio sp.]